MRSDTITARHPGRCGLCDDPICVDDVIVHYDGEWTHERCAELEDQVAVDVVTLRDGQHINQQRLPTDESAAA